MKETDNLLALLERFNSDRANQITENFPELTSGNQGRILGETPEKELSESQKLDDVNQLKAAISLAKESLDEAHKYSSEILLRLKGKRKAIGYLQLGSQVIVAICGATFIMELAAVNDQVKQALGIATLASAVLTIFMQQLKLSFNGEGGIEAMIEKFSGYKYEAKEQLHYLFVESIGSSDAIDEQNKALLSRASLLAFNILQECDKV